MLVIDVWMSSGLRGDYRPLTEVACEPPQPLPDTVVGWQRWATGCLGTLATEDRWQPGRYGYTVERRDGAGLTLQLLGRGVWQLAPLPA